MLPADLRQRQGGFLFIASLLVFFVSSILLYGIYAYNRRDDLQSTVPLPSTFLLSTICLLVISILVHTATRTVRREQRWTTSGLLVAAGLSAICFMGIQFVAMKELLSSDALQGGTGKGVAGMVAVLALLHALHVAGGVIAFGVVSIRSIQGHYDHERHWPIDFAAHYWHFLDGVWLCMLFAFWTTTGGFSF